VQIDVGPEEPETALHAAASAHQVSLLREILSKLGPYTPENKQLVDLLQKPDRIGLTPLHCPIHEDDKLKSRSPGNMRQCLELLIKAHQGCEVSVDQRDARSAETPLALASAADFTLVISQLHEAGADINAAARRNETPLMAAALNGSVAATQTLLKLGADVHAKTASQESVLHVVVCERLPTDKEAQIVEILLDAGADLQAVDAEGRTPIDWVASLGNPTLVRSPLVLHLRVLAAFLQGL
jgi:ankyrin repeat protein